MWALGVDGGILGVMKQFSVCWKEVRRAYSLEVLRPLKENYYLILFNTSERHCALLSIFWSLRTSACTIKDQLKARCEAVQLTTEKFSNYCGNSTFLPVSRYVPHTSNG